MKLIALFCMLFSIFWGCGKPEKANYVQVTSGDAVHKGHNNILLALPDSASHVTHIETGKTKPLDLVSFANTLKGIPYRYASTDPEVGFDCSGFIAYVFNHFGIAVPRSSVDFTFVRREININEAKPGDLILFTGTDSTIRIVGHMGIITSWPGDTVKFIHSSSGKAYGVTVTPMNSYYVGRYVKTIRVFEDK